MFRIAGVAEVADDLAGADALAGCERRRQRPVMLGFTVVGTWRVVVEVKVMVAIPVVGDDRDARTCDACCVGWTRRVDRAVDSCTYRLHSNADDVGADMLTFARRAPTVPPRVAEPHRAEHGKGKVVPIRRQGRGELRVGSPGSTGVQKMSDHATETSAESKARRVHVVQLGTHRLETPRPDGDGGVRSLLRETHEVRKYGGLLALNCKRWRQRRYDGVDAWIVDGRLVRRGHRRCRNELRPS